MLRAIHDYLMSRFFELFQGVVDLLHIGQGTAESLHESCSPCLSGRALKHKLNVFYSVKPLLNYSPKHHEKHSRPSPFRKTTSGFRIRNFPEPIKTRRNILASYFCSILPLSFAPRQYRLLKFLY
jgi:hypothetical protein